jgi:hypothetical protein
MIEQCIRHTESMNNVLWENFKKVELYKILFGSSQKYKDYLKDASYTIETCAAMMPSSPILSASIEHHTRKATKQSINPLLNTTL